MYSSSCDVMACRSPTPTHMPSHGSGLKYLGWGVGNAPSVTKG